MSEDAPELTAELVVDGVVPSQPVIPPDGCWVAYVVAPARPGTAQRRRHLRPHRPGLALPAEPVTNALLNGHTWHDIAQALATSPGESRRRFDPDSPVANPTTPNPQRPPHFKSTHQRQTRTTG